jgi:hypothetical protein
MSVHKAYLMSKCLVLICFIFISCSTYRMQETALYFGQSKPDGSTVTEQEWKDFLQEYIPKVFKEGFSVTRIQGFWKDTVTRKLITEPTYQVIYYYKLSSSKSIQIDSLRYWYQKLFQQQSVLRVDRKVRARF